MTEESPEPLKPKQALGKSLSQLQAEQMASRMFADLMSSAGVGSYRIGQELMWMIPRAFLDAYEELFTRAFGSRDDGGANLRGQAAASSGVLQKGKTAAKTNGKRYKKHWVIADENAMRLREKVDKRLRALAREIHEGLVEEDGGSRGNNARQRVCKRCGRMAAIDWVFCPQDGSRIDSL